MQGTFVPKNFTSHKSRHFTPHHYTSHHFTYVHSIPTWIPCPIVLFDKLTSENRVWSNDRFPSGLTLHDWVSSYRHFGETRCLQLSCFKVPRYSLRTGVLRFEGDILSRNVGSYLPIPETSHSSRP